MIGGTQIKPKEVIRKRIISNIQNEKEQVQQAGIDLTVKDLTVLMPRGVAIVDFNELFDMKKHYGILFLRSSVARQGLLISIGLYDPGYEGCGGCTIHNNTDVPKTFYPGDRLAQMVIFTADPDHLYKNNHRKTIRRIK